MRSPCVVVVFPSWKTSAGTNCQTVFMRATLRRAADERRPLSRTRRCLCRCSLRARWAYHAAVCGCVERSDMTTKKICFHCYSELFPDKPIRKVTLGRQCVVCKKSTDKVEQMVPVEAEDL